MLIRDLVAKLPPKLAVIVRLRFGFINGHELTLEEVGEKFGYTKQAIGNSQTRIFKILRRRLKKALAES